MKNLIEKIFKREPALNYVIAEYRPNNNFVPKQTQITEYEIDAGNDADEMQIDNIYQKS